VISALPLLRLTLFAVSSSVNSGGYRALIFPLRISADRCNPGFSCSCSAANPTEAAHSRCTSAISPAASKQIVASAQPASAKTTSAKQVSPAPLSQLVPEFLQPLQWRSIGPYRGGRTRAVSGVPSQPGVFYLAYAMAVCGRPMTMVRLGNRFLTISQRAPSAQLP